MELNFHFYNAIISMLREIEQAKQQASHANPWNCFCKARTIFFSFN